MPWLHIDKLFGIGELTNDDGEPIARIENITMENRLGDCRLNLEFYIPDRDAFYIAFHDEKALDN